MTDNEANLEQRPAFLGIGAQKAGTTWLNFQLRAHPHIWMPPVKELHYFSREMEERRRNRNRHPFLGSYDRYRIGKNFTRAFRHVQKKQYSRLLWEAKWFFGGKGDAWYRSLFPAGKVTGEITPEYALIEKSDIERIHRINPKMKIIFMLRNPIARSWSSVRYNAKRGFSGLDINSFEEVSRVIRHEYSVLRSDYLVTIDRYLEVFPPEQILIAFFDAVEHDPVNLVTSVWDFLGVKERPAQKKRLEKVRNPSPRQEMPAEILELLCEIYEPKVRAMTERLGSYTHDWLSAIEQRKSESEPGVVPGPRPPVLRLDRISEAANS